MLYKLPDGREYDVDKPSPCPECGGGAVNFTLTPVDCATGNPNGEPGGGTMTNICGNKNCRRFWYNTNVPDDILGLEEKP